MIQTSVIRCALGTRYRTVPYAVQRVLGVRGGGGLGHASAIGPLCILMVTLNSWFAASAWADEVSSDIPPSGYVADRRCAECHQKEWKSFQHVGMSQSIFRPTADRIIEDFENNSFYHKASNRHYEMLFDDEGMSIRRYQIEAGGKIINELRQHVDWIIGSGNHARTYAIQNEAGELNEAPIAWYTQLGQWNMTAGFDRADHPGMTRRISRECIHCHTAYPDLPDHADLFGEPDVFPKTLPEGIGCQRCHGPGAQHVTTAGDEQSVLGAIRATIVNPAKLEPQLRDDVCHQCHLQPTVKVSTLTRFGKGTFDYRPGERLSDTLIFFDGDGSNNHPTTRFELNHHPYRLYQSTCYVKSGGAMSCLTCHDPHRKVRPEEREAHFRNKCLTCHGREDCDIPPMPSGDVASPDMSSGDCISCHMPKRHPQSVTRVVRTDHRIQRVPLIDEPPRTATEWEPIEHCHLEFYEADRAPTTPLDQVYLALNETLLGAAQLSALRDAIDRAKPTHPDPYGQLGLHQLAQGDSHSAMETFLFLNEHWPDRSWIHHGLGRALNGIGQREQALQYFRTALENDPDNPDYHFSIGARLANERHVDGAIHHLSEAIRLRPLYADAHHTLGSLLARNDQIDDAIKHLSTAVTINPRRPDTAIALGHAHFSNGATDEALRTWRHAINENSEHARLHEFVAIGYLNAYLIHEDQLDPAIKAASRAHELAPRRGQTWVLIACTALANGELNLAAERATTAQAYGAHPALCAAVQLASIVRSNRDRDAALQLSQLVGAMPAASRDLLTSTVINVVKHTVSDLTVHLQLSKPESSQERRQEDKP